MTHEVIKNNKVRSLSHTQRKENMSHKRNWSYNNMSDHQRVGIISRMMFNTRIARQRHQLPQPAGKKISWGWPASTPATTTSSTCNAWGWPSRLYSGSPSLVRSYNDPRGCHRRDRKLRLYAMGDVRNGIGGDRMLRYDLTSAGRRPCLAMNPNQGSRSCIARRKETSHG